MREYTEQEITNAYEHLIWAQGLIDFVLKAGFDLNHGDEAEMEGSLISIFSILQEYLKPAETILTVLDEGHSVGTRHEKKKENEA